MNEEDKMSESVLDVQQVRKRRNIYLFFSTLTLLFLGLIYAFSMFAKPMTQDFGLEGNIGLTFNIMMITFCVGALCGSVIEKRFGVKGALITSAVLFALGFCGSGVLGPSVGDTTILYVFYGVLGGAGVGIGYNTIIATTNVWFPDKVGFSSGILMMGFGMSSLLFGNIALLLRPILGGMSPVLTILGIVVAVLTVVLAFVLKRPPSNIVALMAPEKAKAGQAEDLKEESIFKTPIFYIYYVWAIIVIAIGLATIGNAASDAVRVGIEEGFASLLVGLVSTFNGLSRIVIGLLFDKTNIKVTMFIDALVAVSATVLIVVAFATSSSWLYIPGALLCGFAYGGVPVIASAFSRQRYGAKRYPFNLSVVNFAIALGSLLNILVMAVLGSENRMSVFMVMLVLSIVAAMSVFFFSRQWNKDVSKKEAH